MGNTEQTISSLMGSFLLLAILVLKVSCNAEGDALNALKNSLIDPNGALQSWDSTLINPCTWFNVICNSDKSVIRIHLGNANLSGQLVPQLGQLPNLQYFDLVDKNLSGQLVPQLGQLPNLQYLELYSNNITGKIPDELGNLTNLVSLELYLNKLTGPIPDTLGNLKKLRFLQLNDNSLSGNIPMSLTTVASLQDINLSNNQLKGVVPVNGSFSLFTPVSFQNNSGLFQEATRASPLAPPLAPPQQTTSGNGDSIATRAIAAGAAAGGVLLFAAPVIALAYWQRRKAQDYFSDVHDEEDSEVHLGQLRKFSLRELKDATEKFNNKHILGGGGFRKVYKGRLADGSLVAVKRLKKERTHSLELQISMTVHRNLLQLRGFCVTPTERLLVYPFMVNGSVASRLRERPESQPPLDWPIRKRIALGAAKGLAYLHEYCHPMIIHLDVKAANILLDEEFEAVVGDFGLSKVMDYNDTHVTTLVRGTIGHIAPEYLSTGKSSVKIDVYGYGVMLLELITGHRALDLGRLANDVDMMLLNWVKGLLKDNRLTTLVDADLQGYYDEKEVEQLIQVALLCTQSFPRERPKMSEVVRMLEGDGLAEKWDEWQEKEMIRDDFNHNHQVTAAHWLLDSTSNIPTNELSGSS